MIFLFRKNQVKEDYFDGEVAWNGNNLKGLKKTDFFIINLSPGTHILNFLIDRSPLIEAIRIYQIEESEISFLPKNNLPPQNGNCRQWLTIINDSTKSFYSPINDVFNVEQNITAGIKYFKYLYQERYKGDKDRLKKAVAAYNAGPNNVPKEEPLNLSLYEEQTQKLVKCVLENSKRKDWKNILWPFLISLLMFAGISGIWYLNQIDFFEPVISEKEYFLSQVSSFPALILENEKNQIVFFTSQGKIAKKIPTERLNLDKIFATPEEIKGSNLIHLNSEVIEGPKNVFYFLAATSWSCGQNCSWVFFKYDFKKDKLDILDEHVLAQGVDLYPSQNFEKMALVRYVFGGYCNSGGYLKIIDLKKNYQKEEINDFKDEDFTAESVDSLIWKDGNTIEIKVSQGCSKSGQLAREGTFIYNIENKSIKLIKEKHFPRGG